MILWLCKRYCVNLPPQKHRSIYGMVCGAVGIGLNVVLFFGKMVAGLLAGSIAIMADGFNNLSDAGSSLVTLLGFRLAEQKPDPHHPFGHGRIEYLAGLVVALMIILMGLELGQQSVGQILQYTPVMVTPLTIGILAVSIVVKLYMYSYNRRIGKEIDSVALKATATDSLSDVVATSVVLLATIAGQVLELALDGWCGLAVAGFILLSGLRAGKDTIDPLLGSAPSPELVVKIQNIVLAHDCVLGMHDLMIHDYGPGRMMISLHAEVPAEGDFLQLHEEIDQAEQTLGKELGCNAVIHMDPIVTTDGITQPTAQKVEAIVKQINATFHIHDFRMVPGEVYTKLIFDLVVPYQYDMEDGVIADLVNQRVQTLDPNYRTVVVVERG
ncbi:cation diffusion facilitator family transporter [Bengtsoniella intestinalis]|uniref:cation diffusion facilitator family transporter n=1 Tax=Bengtsoniella intestinalis TaxID=3073143 RepID=UPI00391F4AD5